MSGFDFTKEADAAMAAKADRVRAADAEAEDKWRLLHDEEHLLTKIGPTPAALIAIAAELRAERIARRPRAES